MKWLCAVLMAGLVALAAFQASAQPPAAGHAGLAGPANGFEGVLQIRGTVLSARDANSYTYVEVKTDEAIVWAAVPQTPVKAGDSITIADAMPMADFYSRSFGRVFETLYMASSLRIDGEEPTIDLRNHASSSKPEQAVVEVSGIERLEGGKTIGEIWNDRQALAGQTVTFRGKVVKSTSRILGRNWIHLRDGTTGEGDVGELTVTTSASPEVGSTILVSGTVAVDRDFGYGYQYDLLIENASITVE